MQMQNMIVAALSMTILPTMVPAVAAMPTTGFFGQAKGSSSIVISAVGLKRFGGDQVASAAGSKVLFGTSPHAQFPPSEAALEIPLWSQLLMVSVLLGVFAAAIAEDADDANDKQIKLVRPCATAARLAVAVGCFGLREASKSEAVNTTPVWAQLLYISLSFGIFAAAASNSEVESDQETKKVVKLVRVPAIASRIAFAAGLFGAPGAIRALVPMLPSGSPNFPSSGASMDVPAWGQLLLVSVLLGVFAAAASDEEEKEEDDTKKTIELVRAPAIAARLAAAAGLFGMPGALRAASTYLQEAGLRSSLMFPSADANMDVPMWAQLIVASVLLGVFAAAVSDDVDKEEKSTKVVELVRVPAIAARLAIAAALFGAPGAARAISAISAEVGPSPSFATSDLTTDVPAWAQLAVVSMLLGIFALATSEEEEKDSETGVKLVRVPAIAGRLAVAAACFALHEAVAPSVPKFCFSGLGQLSTFGKAAFAWSPVTSSPVFASVETTLDTPVWTQLLVVSFLLLVFAALVKSESAENKDIKVSSKQVQLVRPDAIAARLGVAAALFAIREVMPPVASTALSGDVLTKGGLLVAGTALALSGEIQKSMRTKKVA